MSEKTALTNEKSQQIKNRWESNELVLRPPVNIFENAGGIILEADMPGVDKDGLTIQLEKGRLFVEGKAQVDMPKDLEPLYADVRTTNYQFSFALSNELDTANVDASLTDGVLKLQIPKRAELQPRKIEVRVG